MGERGEEIQIKNRAGTVMRFWLLVGLLVSQVAIAQTGGNQAVFDSAKAWAGSKNEGIFSGTTSNAANSAIPKYGTNPPESGYFAGGKGQTSGYGAGKIQSCATATPDSDPIKRQECEAVNFLARNPNVRPQFDLSNNSMFDKAKNIRNNAENIFASLGVGGTGSSTQCVPRTITTPAQYSTDTCSSIREVGEQQCTMGRVINIDTDANFQCEQTVNAYETVKCTKELIVTSTTKYKCPATGNVIDDKNTCDSSCMTTGTFGYRAEYFVGGCGAGTPVWLILPQTNVSVNQCPAWMLSSVAQALKMTEAQLRQNLAQGKSYLITQPNDEPCNTTSCLGTFTATTGTACVTDQSVSSQWLNNCATLEARSQ